MKKEYFVLGISLLLCVGGLTGCGFLDEKETATSSQETKENATKKNVEVKEESNEAIKKKEPQDNATEESDKETNKVTEKEKASLKPGNKQEENSTKAAEKTEPASSRVDWGSTWSRNIDTDPAGIDITNLKSNTFKFKLNSNHLDNPNDVSTGLVSAGDVEGTAKIEGNVATQITDDIESGCMIKMTNHTSYIQVEEISNCSRAGGIGVYYEGRYQKGDIVSQEENTNDNTTSEDAEEEKQDQEKNEEPSTEETPPEKAQNLLTHEEAEQLVKEFLSLSMNNMYYVYDGDTPEGNYSIRVYQYQEATADSTEHEAFYGFYTVNPQTGEVADAYAD
ncbi:hypothetical protein [Priestia megaterium]|uniref:hypothetical protein n=1 Tax=Priestia megaterium TaxID=1404 RepID=UPI0013E36038|nr:hypothetical protein [Priestia megaterium]MED3865022.1 hypothetical protein [Priestia megaterium]MED4098560.1 hypothetical protein [Priestia megaterium]MED4145819.1 hypothetical protein [Priestia megaterium]MED4168885.1 hypothetical protein [Priestia megaterium]MED4198598.1 hypothetical protein [Priestia megaterium]